MSEIQTALPTIAAISTDDNSAMHYWEHGQAVYSHVLRLAGSLTP